MTSPCTVTGNGIALNQVEGFNSVVNDYHLLLNQSDVLKLF